MVSLHLHLSDSTVAPTPFSDSRCCNLQTSSTCASSNWISKTCKSLESEPFFFSLFPNHPYQQWALAAAALPEYFWWREQAVTPWTMTRLRLCASSWRPPWQVQRSSRKPITGAWKHAGETISLNYNLCWLSLYLCMEKQTLKNWFQCLLNMLKGIVHLKLIFHPFTPHNFLREAVVKFSDPCGHSGLSQTERIACTHVLQCKKTTTEEKLLATPVVSCNVKSILLSLLESLETCYVFVLLVFIRWSLWLRKTYIGLKVFSLRNSRTVQWI